MFKKIPMNPELKHRRVIPELKKVNFNRDDLRDRIYACWIGKNIGGTVGTPFEGIREVNNCEGFSTKPGQPLPNDDLDLQLVWLYAMAEEGPKKLNSKILGEYWLEYVCPYWNEYGICKSNMRNGLVPPLSGQYKNQWRHSNGAWIRTEVWATLFPGDVENAIRFAYEDACVDHGSGEGTYAAIFVAALESLAFVVDDIRTLISLGLSKIPEKSRMHKFITKTLECYDSGMTWLDTRNLLVEMSLADEELGWFQAPANVSFAVIGLLWGEGDFKKSILTACRCADDSDCTCATVGAILGLMHGTKIIPKDWQEYIGDSIITISVNGGALQDFDTKFMKSCQSLTDKVMSLHPVTLNGTRFMVSDAATDTETFDLEGARGNDFAMSLEHLSDYYLKYDSSIAKYTVEYDREPQLSGGEQIKIRLSIINKFISQKNYRVEWILPEGWSVEGKKNISVHYQCPDKIHNEVVISEEYTVTAPEELEATNTLLLSVKGAATIDETFIPVVIMG